MIRGEAAKEETDFVDMKNIGRKWRWTRKGKEIREQKEKKWKKKKKKSEKKNMNEGDDEEEEGAEK